MNNKIILPLVFAIFISGCASNGPTYTEIQPKLPELAEGKGRVYIFTKDVDRGGKIDINNQYLGTLAWDDTFLYADLPEGSHTIKANSTGLIAIEYEYKFSLKAGETVFYEFERTWANIRLTKLEVDDVIDTISKCRYAGTASFK